MIRPQTPQPDPSIYSHLSEKERMIAGFPYKPQNEILRNDRINCRNLCEKFNTIPSIDYAGKSELLKQLLSPNSSTKIKIMNGFKCDYGYNINLAESVEINYNCVFLDASTIHVGKNTMFAPGVQIYTSTHPLDPQARLEYELAKPIKIGENVWIGGNSTILPSVCIGNNVVVGAGSVVTKNVPDNTVIAGNPAKIIRFLPGYNGDFNKSLN